jgi:hypothetical protein
MNRLKPVCRLAVYRWSFFKIGWAVCLIVAINANGAVIVTPTTNEGDLENALNPTGLSITSVSVLNGSAGQYGTYTNYTAQPITIGNGVVLSSGDVSFVGPPADPSLESPQPSYDMGTPGTAEFDAYGPGHIENFQSSNDTAVLRVDFSLDDTSQVQFDFVFGSVEYPFYTSSFTDAFLVFLDGTDATNQITHDQSGSPVQVGSSFAGLVATADQNTAFAFPHGVLGLTTTTAELDNGIHTLLFEIADVNDHVLDSAVFISNLRTGVGDEGTEPTDPEDYFPDCNHDGVIDAADYVVWRKTDGTQLGYDIWRANFGRSHLADIPEPTTLLLAMFGSMVVAWIRRRADTRTPYTH